MTTMLNELPVSSTPPVTPSMVTGQPPRRRRSGPSRWHALATHHLPMLVRTAVLRRWPAWYKRWAMRPFYAGLNVTDNCNMRCIMCNSWRAHSADELTTQEWTRVLDELYAAGVRYVGFAGGEPLLRKDLPALVAHAHALGLHTELTTSGYLLDEARLEALLAAGLDSAVISIDGVKEQYEAIRHREWSRVERGCGLLAAAHRAGRVQAIIGFVLMGPTLDHLAGVQQLSERLGLPLVISLLDVSTYLFQLEDNNQAFWIRSADDRRKLAALQRTLADDRARCGVTRDDYTVIESFRRYFEDPRLAKVPCTVSQSRILIDSHGMVFGGCWALGSYGCLRSQSLAEVLRSETYRAAHEKMFRKECPGCSCGYKVSLKYSLPTQWREWRLRVSRRLRDRVFAVHD